MYDGRRHMSHIPADENEHVNPMGGIILIFGYQIDEPAQLWIRSEGFFGVFFFLSPPSPDSLIDQKEPS